MKYFVDITFQHNSVTLNEQAKAVVRVHNVNIAFVSTVMVMKVHLTLPGIQLLVLWQMNIPENVSQFSQLRQ